MNLTEPPLYFAPGVGSKVVFKPPLAFSRVREGTVHHRYGRGEILVEDSQGQMHFIYPEYYWPPYGIADPRVNATPRPSPTARGRFGPAGSWLPAGQQAKTMLIIVLILLGLAVMASAGANLSSAVFTSRSY